MPDPLDETGITDGRGVSNFSARERRPLDLPLDEEDMADLNIMRTVFPGLMMAAAVLWLVAGAVCLAIFGLARLLQLPFQVTDALLVLGGCLFIKDGVQLIRGAIRDPMQYGVVSLLVGLFLIGQSFFQLNMAGSWVTLLFGIFFGALFVTPGILVLLGRKRYLAWKSDQEN